MRKMLIFLIIIKEIKIRKIKQKDMQGIRNRKIGQETIR